MPGQAQKANTIGQEVWSLETKKVRKLLQDANPTAVIITVLILISLGIAEISYMGTKDSLEKIQCKSGDAKVCQKVVDDDASIRNNNKWIASLSRQIIITDKNILVEAGLSEDEGQEAIYEGLTDQNTGKIYIYAPEYSGLDTLKHEYYHLVDYTLGDSSKNLYISENVRKKVEKLQQDGTNSLSKSDRWKSLIEKNVGKYTSMFAESSYDISSYQEAFVSVMLTFDEKGSELKKEIPGLYNYAKEVHSILVLLQKESL